MSRPSTRPRVTRTNSSRPKPGGDLSRRHRPDHRGCAGPGALKPLQRGLENLPCHHDGGHRVAGNADDGLPGHHPQHRRLPRHHLDTVHQEVSLAIDHLGGEVVLARRGPGDEGHQMMVPQGLAQRLAQERRIVADSGECLRRAAGLGHHGAQHGGVEIDDLAGGGGWRRARRSRRPWG